MILEITEDGGYVGCIRDILCHPVFQSMDQYMQHGATTCKTHYIQVSYLGYRLCKQLGRNRRSAVRAGPLHDSFLYDWHTYTKETGQYFHEFTRPKAASANVDRYLRLTGEERTIILRHIWPLTLTPLVSRAGYAVTCAGKCCNTVEATARFKHWIRTCLSAQPARRQSYVLLEPSRSPFERGKNNPIMNVWTQMPGNQLLMSTVTGWVVAQLSKILIDFILNKNFNAERLVGSGGMPSSHSVTVCSLTTTALLKYEAGSFRFAMSFVLSMIVMYDAIGVRREIGKQVKPLNSIPSENPPKLNAEVFQEKLEEYMGHTPLQVLVGATLGIGLALALNSYY